MLVVPLVMGLSLGFASAPESGPSPFPVWSGTSGPDGFDWWWAAVLAGALTLAWVIGYFAFFAWGLWLKFSVAGRAARTGAAQTRASGRQEQRRREAAHAVEVYGVIAALTAVVCLLLRPSLLWWSVLFGPLVAIAMCEAWRRRPRSLLSGVSTTLASALLVPAAASSIAGQVPPLAWWWAGVLAVYFTGTVLYVKTMIRERRNPRYLQASIGYHLFFAALALVLAMVRSISTGSLAPSAIGEVSAWAVAAIAGLTALRSWAVPLSRQRGKQWTPKDVGKLEGVITALLVGALVV